MPSVTLREAAQHPLAAQSHILPVREYLNKSYGWLFDPVKPALVTNSQQLLKHVLQQGNLTAITSQMDVAEELLSGKLWFAPIHEKGIKPQSLSVVVDARRSLSHAARLIGEILSDILERKLKSSKEVPSPVSSI